MKNIQKTLLAILGASFLLALAGFFADSDVNDASLWRNLFEIGMLAVFIFGIATVSYFLANSLFRAAKQLLHSGR